MTSVARSVIGRLAIICIPATSMRAPLKNRAAAITGRGIFTMRPANFGRHDKRTSQQAMDQAITRLVAPVVFSTLTRLGLALMPGVPNKPPAEAAKPVRPHTGFDVSHIRATPSRIVHLLTSSQNANNPQTRGKSSDRKRHGKGRSELIG